MNAHSIISCQRSFRDEMQRHCPKALSRLHWTVMNAIGLRPTDVLCAPIDLKIFQAIAYHHGARHTRHSHDATVIVFWNAAESEVLSQIGKLDCGARLVAYNDESKMDELSLRSFEQATACLFDPEAAKIVRIIDGLPRRVRDYLHIELGELSDSALGMHAQRIAALR